MKFKHLSLSLAISLFHSLFSLVKAEVLVSTVQELNQAIILAKPGSVIIMKDGIWHDAVINFNSKATKSLKITLKAQTPGKVILNGSSRLTFSAPFLIVDGLYFKSGAIDESSNSVVNFASESCRLTNVAIIDYNPVSFDTKYY